ncbi:MAG: hypothetical protein J7J67_01345 [Thermoproteales archaeon]|nr:hypothetical protein [Thermoproteales archaeon]
MAILCDICHKRKAIAKIEGKYYCYICGKRLILEKNLVLLRNLAKMGLIKLNSEEKD